MGIGWQELVLILIVALVVFGPRRLPEVGRSLGSGIREFRDSFSGLTKATEPAPVPVAEPAATGDAAPAARAVDPS